MRYQAKNSSADKEYEFDYVIIGSGSAGATLAYRLGEIASDSLGVIEFGGSDIGPFIQMPAALSYPMNMRRYDWGYLVAAEPALNGRLLVCPSGKVIGGSSSINRMIYVRGHAGVMIIGRNRGLAAGLMPISCPISRRWKPPLMASRDGAGKRGGVNTPLPKSEHTLDHHSAVM